MSFGTFLLTGDFNEYGDAPVSGYVQIDGLPEVITDPAGNTTFVGPKKVHLDKLGKFSIALPTDSASGNSSTIGFRVTSHLKDHADINATTFYARQIGATVDLADIVTMVVETVGDTTANKNAAQAAQAAAETARDQAVANAGTTDAFVAGRFGTSSLTRTAADARYALAGSAGPGDVTTAQLDDAIDGVLEQVPSLEETFFTKDMLFFGETNLMEKISTGTTTVLLMQAPFPLRVMWVRCTFGAAVAASGSNFYLFRLRRREADGTTTSFIGSTSTADQAILSAGDWPFTGAIDTTGRVLATGTRLSFQIEVTGTPAKLAGPAAVSVGYARA